MSLYKIHPIVMGSKVFDKTFMTYQHGYGETYTIPIYCWYLEGGDKKILVDTGERNPIVSEAREKALGSKIYNFETGLAKWGLKAEDIDIVIQTHLHRDHVENNAKCVNATFYIHENELERAFEPHPLDFRYEEECIWDIEERGQIEKVSGDREIVPGISVMHTPAHTTGGMTVLIDTEKGKAAITGFCTILENFYPPPPVKGLGMEVVPPGTHVDAQSAYDIILKVKGIADIILPLHEPKFARIDTIP